MTKFIANREKDDDKYQVHHLGCRNRPLSNYFYVEAQNMASAVKKAKEETGNTYYACRVCG